MKIVIVGPGAMGCLYAALLTRAGCDVWLLDIIVERVEAIKQKGIAVEGTGGDYRIPFSKIAHNPGIIGTADLVIVWVKAYDTESAIRDAGDIIAEHTTILTLQNGLGNVEAVSAFCSKEQIVAGTTAYGATLLGHGHVRHAGIGETVIGGAAGVSSKRVQEVKAVLERAGIAITTTEDINAILWGKLLINCGINPLTALLRIRNGQILASPELVEVMQRVVEEGVQVAQAEGVAIAYANPQQKVAEVCRLTAENRSSMLQDLEAGRKTEIEYINGAIVRYGKEHGVATPVNSILTDLVLSLEKLQN